MHKQLVLAEAKSSELNARAIADDSRMAQRKQKAKEKASDIKVSIINMSK